MAFVFTALIFLGLSLRLATKLLGRFYNDKVVAATLLVFFLGSNYFYYATGYLSYSHLFSVFFILLFIQNVLLSIKQFSLKRAIYLGLSAGMMTLIRPVDGIFVLLPLFLQLENGFKQRLQYWIQHLKLVGVTCLATLAVWVPQLVYNYYIFEKLTINTYLEERFFFADPETWKVIFSFNNGWLIYSPLMLLAVIGTFVLAKKSNGLGWPLALCIYS